MPASSIKKPGLPAIALSGKYLLLVEHLASRIGKEQFKSGERLPTFIELQEAFGVTPGTVNRAMIALEQRGLIERRRGSGVFVAEKPSTRAARRSNKPNVKHNIIGLAGFGFQHCAHSSYWSTLLSGVHAAAERSGSQVLLLDCNSPSGWEKADGVLICDWASKGVLRHVPPNLPCVSVLIEVEGVASVAADDYAGTREATEHLLKLGHRRIAYLHGPPVGPAARRIQAYQESLRAARIKPQAKWQKLLLWKHGHEEDFAQAGHEMVSNWLRADWKKLGCTALLCQNDETAVGAIGAFREAGLTVPRDVSVVGFDGMKIGDFFTPRLTTVKLPLEEIGARAMELLQSQIACDEVSSQHDVLRPQLLPRASTAPPA